MNNIYMNVLCASSSSSYSSAISTRMIRLKEHTSRKSSFLFLPYCSLEILHHYAYIKSVEYSTLVDVQQIGYLPDRF